MTAIALSSVCISQSGDRILDDVSLRVGSGETVCLIGSSGSGKSSLLRVIAGLDIPVSGGVVVHGRDVRAPRPDVTMAFQTEAVYDHLDVSGNLEFPFRIGRSPSGGRSQHVDRAASRFSLRRILGWQPAALSTGQRQLVAASRALVRPEVSVALLDEPLAGIDPGLRLRVVDEVVRRQDLTVLLATNDPGDCFRWADRVVVLAGGAIAQVGAADEVYQHPVSLVVAELMGGLNRIPARVTTVGTLRVGQSELTAELLPEGIDRDQPVVVGIRPQKLGLAETGTPFTRRLRATVGRVERLGATKRILFGLGDSAGVGFSAEVDSTMGLEIGQTVDWFVDPRAVRLFDPVTGDAI